MKYIFGIIVILLFLLCSCVTQRGAERYFDRNTEELAEYVDGNLDYTNEHGAAYAAKYFPVKIGPPEIKTTATVIPGRLITVPVVARADGSMPATVDVQCDDVQHTYTSERIPYLDTAKLEAAEKELKDKELELMQKDKQLFDTEAERDAWKEKAQKRFWALVAIGFFAVAWVVFKILAARVKVVDCFLQ